MESQKTGSRFAAWPNRKTKESHPDYRFTIELTLDHLRELFAAAKEGRGVTTNSSGQQVIALDGTGWKGTRPAPSPIVSGTIASLEETIANRQRIADWKAQQQGSGSGQGRPPAMAGAGASGGFTDELPF